MATIQVKTSRFGMIEVDKDTIIHFVSPILGFEHLRKFVLLDHKEHSPFKWLQSVEDPELAFVLTHPKFFAIPYEVSLPEEVLQRLEMRDTNEKLMFTIVNIPPEEPDRMTANLVAPIVINQNNRYAMQVVLPDADFSTQTPLLPLTS